MKYYCLFLFLNGCALKPVPYPSWQLAQPADAPSFDAPVLNDPNKLQYSFTGSDRSFWVDNWTQLIPPGGIPKGGVAPSRKEALHHMNRVEKP